MPAIPDQYLESVVFLYESEEKARQANTLGGGTGFFVNMPLATSVIGQGVLHRYEPALRGASPHDAPAL